MNRFGLTQPLGVVSHVHIITSGPLGSGNLGRTPKVPSRFGGDVVGTASATMCPVVAYGRSPQVVGFFGSLANAGLRSS